MKKDWNFWRGYVKYSFRYLWPNIKVTVLALGTCLLIVSMWISIILFPLVTSVLVAIFGLIIIGRRTYERYERHVRYTEAYEEYQTRLRNSNLKPTYNPFTETEKELENDTDNIGR